MSPSAPGTWMQTSVMPGDNVRPICTMLAKHAGFRTRHAWRLGVRDEMGVMLRPLEAPIEVAPNHAEPPPDSACTLISP
jgi:hypothetical protein